MRPNDKGKEEIRKKERKKNTEERRSERVEMCNVRATNEVEFSRLSSTKNKSRTLPLFNNIGEFAVVLEKPNETSDSVVRCRKLKSFQL